MSERLQFQADISELMNLIINAFYSNRDVFLRELISNASDALDKRRHRDLQDNQLDHRYRIRISAGEDSITIEDNGIGMTREDVVNNLSTIARSGTKEFIKSLEAAHDQIGQFGVGFYSVFLVAREVHVVTQKQGGPAYRWVSDAHDYYTLAEETEALLEDGQGTRVVVYLKEDAREYLEEANIRKIITTHSSFITYPVEIWASKEVPVEEDDDEKDGEVVVEDDETAGKQKKTTTVHEWQQVNGDKPVWTLDPSSVTTEQYHTLYKTISKDYDKPMYYRHFRTEGSMEFRGVLYIPQHPPFDGMGGGKEKRCIRLYVKNVLVLNELDKDMLPDWMSFVVGVIDSPDLPLNVSREMLQQTKLLHTMKQLLRKQVITMITTLLEDQPDLYKNFYESFSRNIKLGIHEGDDGLLRFLQVTPDNGVKTTLDEYIQGLPEGQDKLWYVTGPDGAQSIFTQMYTARGLRVLLFDEPVDEFMLQRVTKYKDLELVNIAKDHDVPWSVQDDSTEDKTAFCEWVRKCLEDGNIENVRISSTLVSADDPPCCVVSSKFGWTGNMEKIMMTQPLGDKKSMFWMKGRKILELNWNHPLIQKYAALSCGDDPVATRELRVLYKTSLLAAGFPVNDTNNLFKDVVQCIA